MSPAVADSAEPISAGYSAVKEKIFQGSVSGPPPGYSDRPRLPMDLENSIVYRFEM